MTQNSTIVWMWFWFIMSLISLRQNKTRVERLINVLSASFNRMHYSIFKCLWLFSSLCAVHLPICLFTFNKQYISFLWIYKTKKIHFVKYYNCKIKVSLTTWNCRATRKGKLLLHISFVKMKHSWYHHYPLMNIHIRVNRCISGITFTYSCKHFVYGKQPGYLPTSEAITVMLCQGIASLSRGSVVYITPLYSSTLK